MSNDKSQLLFPKAQCDVIKSLVSLNNDEKSKDEKGRKSSQLRSWNLNMFGILA